MEHRRHHGSILAAAEQQLLISIAVRLPAAVNSDHLSALGLGCMVAAGAGFAGFRFTPWAGVLVIAALAGNWFGDSLDGTVARVRGHQRPQYGFYVDHVIDLLGATFLLTGLATSGLMGVVPALGLLVAFLLVSAETYLATYAVGVFRLSFLGIGPTELRILIGIGVLRAMWSPHVTIGPLGQQRFFDIAGAIGVIGLAATFIISAVKQTRELYLAEPIRVANTGS